MRTDRYKLIHYYQLDEWELYDLEKDPKELRSVYADPAYAESAASWLRSSSACGRCTRCRRTPAREAKKL